jgi:hypothetical protein
MPTSSIRIAAAVLFYHLSPGGAAAADVTIGGVLLHLPPPPGYCEMDPVLATDAPLIGRLHATLAKTGNRLLVVSADCAELRDWRNGRRQDVQHMAEYQSVIAFESQPLPETPEKMVQNYCANVDGLGDQTMPGTTRDVESRAEQASKISGLNKVEFLGTLASDPLVCYAATFQKFKLGSREETAQVTIIATTILRDKIVSYYLFAPYAGRETFTQLLAKHRTNVNQLQRANRK